MTQRDKILRNVKESLSSSPLIRFVGDSETELTIETLSRFKTPLVVISPGDIFLNDPAIGNQKKIRQLLPLNLLVVVNKKNADETKRLNDLEFEVKRLLYLDRRRGVNAISTDYQNRGVFIDIFEDSVYAGFTMLFNILYTEDLET